MKKPILNHGGMPGMSLNDHAVRCYVPVIMIKKTILFLALFLCITGCRKSELKQINEPIIGASSKTTASVKAIPGAFKVMSFNIHHNDPADPQTLTQRQPLIRQIIVDNTPDIVGLQEFSNTSFKTWFVPEMTALGYGNYYTEVGAYGSPKVIFYKTSRFSLQSSGTLDLGGQGNTATWVVLLDNTTSKQYFISNSHWQYNSQTDRIENSQKLADGIQQYNTQGLPVITFGDFNAIPGTTEINNLKSDLDVVDALGDVNGGFTFHGWDAVGEKKLDWVMSDRNMAYTAGVVITTSYNGFWPSDHWPVMAWYVPAIFSGGTTDTSGKSASSITKYSFADVNGDGKQDKIYWNTAFDSGRPRVFLSNGNGTFSSAIVHVTGASTYSTTRYYYADLDGDGKDDQIMWTPTLNSGHTRVMLATTGGDFSSTIIDNPEGYSASSSTTYHFADVNGDGKADKIYWNPTFDSGHTRVYMATTGGSFSGTVVSGSEGSSTTAGTLFYYADVNGDNKADKILWHPTLNSGKTMVYLSDGDGTFTESSTFSNSGASSAASATVFYFADVNGDGRADKIYWNPNNYLGQLKIYYAEPTNVFNGPVYSLRGTSQSTNTHFFFSDITGDGKADQNRWNYAELTGDFKNYFAN